MRERKREGKRERNRRGKDIVIERKRETEEE
jgi:hypothetical protein